MLPGRSQCSWLIGMVALLGGVVPQARAQAVEEQGKPALFDPNVDFRLRMEAAVLEPIDSEPSALDSMLSALVSSSRGDRSRSPAITPFRLMSWTAGEFGR